MHHFDSRWISGTRHHGAKALFLIVTDISDRKLAEDRLKDAHRELEERVALRTGELRDANDELMHQIKERISPRKIPGD